MRRWLALMQLRFWIARQTHLLKLYDVAKLNRDRAADRLRRLLPGHKDLAP